MIVITLSDCPISLRGDLTKWFQEINTGVFVGKASARVRDEVWGRVCENIKSGSATMVFNMNNEQGMDFRVHNAEWEPIDFDGLKLMMRPSPARIKKLSALRLGFSNAAKIRMAKKNSRQTQKQKAYTDLSNKPRKDQDTNYPDSYIVVDVETTGLSAKKDEIIEIGAIKVKNESVAGNFHALIRIPEPLPASTQTLTGLTDADLDREGRPICEVMRELLFFLESLPIVSHNVEFDLAFLCTACERCGLSSPTNRGIDTLRLAKRQIPDVMNYKLETLLEYFEIPMCVMHRSEGDCKATKALFVRLKAISEEIS